MSDLINSEWDLNYVAKCLVLISNRYWTFLHLMIRYETIGWLAGIKISETLFHKSFKSAMVLMISDW